jgi:lysophospholipase L1-like esterase
MSRHDGATTADIADQLGAGGLDSLIRDANVIIVSVGYNDQPPYWGADRPCGAAVLDTDDQAIDAVVETTPACVDEVTAQTRATAARVLGRVRGLAPDAQVAVLTAYNSWTGWPELKAKGPETAAAATDVIVYALEQWRTALCEEAEAVGAVCIDLLEPFNGPDGRTPPGGLLAADHTHPSQAGNDRIRDLLLESGLYPMPAASPVA